MSKQFKRIEMLRNDVKVNGQQVECRNASWLGYSRGTLQVGDFFLYRDGADGPRLCRMHYKIGLDPRSNHMGWIVAQRATQDMQMTGEYWVNPDDVIKTIPADRMNPHILAFFEGQVEKNGY